MMLFLVKLLLSHSTQEHTKSLGAFASCLSKPDPFVVALIFTNPAKGIITFLSDFLAKPLSDPTMQPGNAVVSCAVLGQASLGWDDGVERHESPSARKSVTSIKGGLLQPGRRKKSLSLPFSHPSLPPYHYPLPIHCLPYPPRLYGTASYGTNKRMCVLVFVSSDTLDQ